MMEVPRYRPCASAIFAELGDGTGVILDLQTKAYFTLNCTGVFVWKTIAASPADARELAEKLAGEFAVEPHHAVGDIEALLRRLGDESLVEPAGE
ncbi:MAG TPA: PqqD family protein [Polyangiaceae bacterium]|nr:PqqD family protein [Polyangiaceae bacterium]